MTTRLCINCVHCLKRGKPGSSAPANTPAPGYYCRRPLPPSPVDGLHRMMESPCDTERMANPPAHYVGVHNCGPDGYYYVEAKK